MSGVIIPLIDNVAVTKDRLALTAQHNKQHYNEDQKNEATDNQPNNHIYINIQKRKSRTITDLI